MLTRGVTLPRNRRFPLLGLGGSVPLSMPLGLMSGRPFRPFRRAISSRCSASVFSNAATLPNSSASRASSSARLSPERLAGGGTFARNRTESSRSKRKMRGRPHFCPSYVYPKTEKWDDYLGYAKLLRPELEGIDGFVDNIRYRSLTRD